LFDANNIKANVHQPILDVLCRSCEWKMTYHSLYRLLRFEIEVGRSVKLLLTFASTVIPGFSLFEIHDQDFYSLLDMYMYMFRNGVSSSTKEGSVFLCRRYVRCTVVYPCCHGVQVTMYSVHPLSLALFALS
jgi:hypothetical protein